MPAAEPQPAKSLLVLIGADPHESDRAAEAIRVAAGIGAWKKVRVNVCLHGPAVACVTEPPENLESGELIAEHLPSILEHGGQIYGPKALKAGRIKVTAAESLPRLLAAHDARMNFGVPAEALGMPPEASRLDGAALFERIFETTPGASSAPPV
jgi:hypothetical protein